MGLDFDLFSSSSSSSSRRVRASSSTSTASPCSSDQVRQPRASSARRSSVGARGRRGAGGAAERAWAQATPMKRRRAAAHALRQRALGPEVYLRSPNRCPCRLKPLAGHYFFRLLHCCRCQALLFWECRISAHNFSGKACMRARLASGHALCLRPCAVPQAIWQRLHASTPCLRPCTVSQSQEEACALLATQQAHLLPACTLCPSRPRPSFAAAATRHSICQAPFTCSLL